MKEFKPILKNFDEVLDSSNNAIFKNTNENFFKDFGKINTNNPLKLYSSLADKLGGSLPKNFCLCDSNSLKELFDEVKKPNSSYITCYNNLIKNDYNGKDVPIKFIPVMVKEYDLRENKYGVYTEELCSKISNLFNVETSFIKSFEHNNKLYILSVDFMQENTLFETLGSYGYINHNDHFLYYSEYISNILAKTRMVNPYIFYKEVNKLDDYDLSLQDKIKIEEKLIEQFLFRKYIIKDNDFYDYNVGILYNTKTKEYSLAPNFDMECAFESEQSKGALTAYLKNFNCYYPNILKNFIKKSQNILKKNLLNYEVFENVYFYEGEEYKKQIIDNLIKRIKENITKLNCYYKKAIKEKELTSNE